MLLKLLTSANSIIPHRLQVCALIFLLVSRASFAQFDPHLSKLNFKHFGTAQGLSQSSVNCIIRDSAGFMWFGTEDGLNRFDGTQFKIFRDIPNDSFSIRGNTVTTLLAHTDGNLWVGTSMGINYYDRHLERFKYFRFESSTLFCFDLFLDAGRNKLWVAAGDRGLYYLDINTGKVHKCEAPAIANISFLKILFMKGKLYAGTLEDGLLVIDTATFAVENIPSHRDSKGRAHNLPVRSMLAEEEILWFGTEGGGLNKLNIVNKTIESFTTKTGHLSDDKVWSLGKDSKGSIWVGTDGGGICVLSPSAMSLQANYRHSDYDDLTVSSNTFRTIYIEPDGSVWLGTYNGGVNYYKDPGLRILMYKRNIEDATTLSHNGVLSFAETTDGTLWIGTSGGGLNYIKDDKFHQLNFPPPLDNPSVITCLYADNKGGLWIGTYQEGLFYLDPKHRLKQYKHDPHDTTSISRNVTWTIVPDSTGNLWVATDFGMNHLDVSTGKFYHYRNKPSWDNGNLFFNRGVQGVLVDSKNYLWVGYVGGVIRHNLSTHSEKSYESKSSDTTSIPNQIILFIHEDKKNTIWLGAYGGGLVKYNEEADNFTTINERKGLPNGLLFSIEEDDHGNFWLASNKGLIRYNPEQHYFDLFDESFGIKSAPFMDNSSYKTRDGHLLFGGSNGFNILFPGVAKYNKDELKVVLTSFRLFNEEVAAGSELLPKSITETSSLELSAEQAKFVSFRFSALHFQAPHLIRFQYMLEGFSQSWREINDNSQSVTFTNLHPGQYKLRIKAGSIGNMLGEETVLEINVIPPWYLTWYAQMAGAILVLGLAYGLYKYRTYTLRIRKRELEKVVQEQSREILNQNVKLATRNEELLHAQLQTKQINESLEILVEQRTQKLNETIIELNKTIKELDAFVYSASHDLVAPLKSVHGLVNLARMENGNGNTITYLDYIDTSVNKLEAVIKSMMKYSMNVSTGVKTEQVDLKLIVDESIALVQFAPGFDRINFQLELGKDTLVQTDSHRIKIIFDNLINNAIKYHDPAKSVNIVKIKLDKLSSSWVLTIYDNGIGIEKHLLSNVFDMFFRATEHAKGSGLGLYIVKEAVTKLQGEIQVDSETGQWAKFTVTIPNF